MRTVEAHLLEDKMDEAVTHYINSHHPSEPVHIDTNGIPMTVQDDGAGRVTIMHQQTYTTQMCRQVSVTEQVGDGPWGEELLEGPIAAIVAHLQNSRHHPPPHHKVAQVRTDVDTSVILDSTMRFNGQSLEQQGEPIVVQLPPMQTLPPLQDMKRCADSDWFTDKNKKQDDQSMLQDSDSQVLELASSSPAQHKQQSRKSLPHKKRISRKLKRNNGNSTPQQDQLVVINCNDAVAGPQEQEQILPDNYVAVSHPHHMPHEVRPVLICQICGEYYGEEQLKFYHHLRQHYEPHTIIIENPVPDLPCDKMSTNCIVDNVATLPDSIVELSLENTVPKTLYQPIDKHILYTSSDKTLTYNTNKMQYSMASMEKEPVPVEADKADLYETLDKLELYNCGKCTRTFRKQKHFEAHMRDAHPPTKCEDMGEFSEPEDLMAGIQVCVGGEYDGAPPSAPPAAPAPLLPHLTVDNGHVHQDHTWYGRAGQGGGGPCGGYCSVCARDPDTHYKLLKEEVLQRIFDSEVSDNANFADNMISDHDVGEQDPNHDHDNDHGHSHNDHGHNDHGHGHNDHGHGHNEHRHGHEQEYKHNEHSNGHNEQMHGHNDHQNHQMHNDHTQVLNEHLQHSDHSQNSQEHNEHHHSEQSHHDDGHDHNDHSHDHNDHSQEHIDHSQEHDPNDEDYALIRPQKLRKSHIMGQEQVDHGQENNESEEHITLIRQSSKTKLQVKHFSCSKCERVFSHRNSLLYHLLSHGGKQHTCRECGKEFYTHNALKIHRRVHNNVRPYKCETCGREFRQWSDLKYHNISLHSDKKHFKCEYCGKEFARKYSLNLHVRIHTGEKNYKCDYCSKTFRCSSYKLTHMRTHTGDRPYKCDECDKRFRSAFDLRRHSLIHDKIRNRFDEHKPKSKENNKKSKMTDIKEEVEEKNELEPSPKKIKQIAVASTARQATMMKKLQKPKKIPKKGAPNVTIQNRDGQFKINDEFTNNVEVYDGRVEYAKLKNILYTQNDRNQIVFKEEQNQNQRDLAILRPIGHRNESQEKLPYRPENTDGKMQVFTHVEKGKDYNGSIVSNTQVLGDMRHLEREVAREVRGEIPGEGIETAFLERLTAMYNIPAV